MTLSLYAIDRNADIEKAQAVTSKVEAKRVTCDLIAAKNENLNAHINLFDAQGKQEDAIPLFDALIKNWEELKSICGLNDETVALNIKIIQMKQKKFKDFVEKYKK